VEEREDLQLLVSDDCSNEFISIFEIAVDRTRRDTCTQSDLFWRWFEVLFFKQVECGFEYGSSTAVSTGSAPVD
jgi:hypothetical protein